jgi:hypothetical protein
VPLELGHRIAGGAEVCEAGQLRGEAAQIGGNAEHHRSTRCLHHGEIAQELQRVAEPLLHIEQDARSVQRLAVPVRLLEIARLIRGLPAPLVVPQARREVPKQ